MRIAIGGFHHETNTFSTTPATFERFLTADGWPGMLHGDEMLSVLKGKNIAATGMIEACSELGYEIVPLCWCNAAPCGKVTADAFEKVSGILLETLKEAGQIDALLLDLHGAMVTETFDDGEGEFLRRVREQTNSDLPVVVSLDFHANLTKEMMALADQLLIYRSYPHVDMAETGRKSVYHLAQHFTGDIVVHKAFRQLPFLVPNTVGCTMTGSNQAGVRLSGRTGATARYSSYFNGARFQSFRCTSLRPLHRHLWHKPVLRRCCGRQPFPLYGGQGRPI